jgi:hypothetical protein
MHFFCNRTYPFYVGLEKSREGGKGKIPMNMFVMKIWLSTFLSFLTGFLPMPSPQNKALLIPPMVKISQAPARHEVRKKAAVTKPKSATVADAGATYLFSISGLATEQGVPKSADLVLRVTTPFGEEIHSIPTAPDGSYHLTLPVHAKANDPVDWEIKGRMGDDETIENVGRQIALLDESLVPIRTTLNFSPK